MKNLILKTILPPLTKSDVPKFRPLSTEKSVQLHNPAPSHERLIKIPFIVKPFKRFE